MGIRFETGGVSLRVTERAHYALRMMTVLARHYPSRELVNLRVIAEEERLPHPFLEQLSMPLRHAGLVHSVRGVKGGYILARDPSEISLYDIVVATDGPIAPVDCLAPQYVEGSCPMDSHCVTAGVWGDLQLAIIAFLQSKSLDLIAESTPIRRTPLGTIALVPDTQVNAS